MKLTTDRHEALLVVSETTVLLVLCRSFLSRSCRKADSRTISSLSSGLKSFSTPTTTFMTTMPWRHVRESRSDQFRRPWLETSHQNDQSWRRLRRLCRQVDRRCLLHRELVRYVSYFLCFTATWCYAVCSLCCRKVAGWVSVTFSYCDETSKCILRIFSLSGCHTILVFLYQNLWQSSNGNPMMGHWMQVRCEKAIFNQYLSQKWYKIGS